MNKNLPSIILFALSLFLMIYFIANKDSLSKNKPQFIKNIGSKIHINGK